MTPVVVDTSVLLGFCDPDNVMHEAADRALTECLAAGRALVVPVTVLSEILVAAFRFTPHAVRTVEGFVDDLVSTVHPIDRSTGRAAAKYRAEHPDMPLRTALVLGTAAVVGADRILTGDPAWRAVDPRVHVLGQPGSPDQFSDVT